MNKYTPEDILARLQAGETVDSLAREFTDALNGAKALQEEEIKKAEEEAKAQSVRRTAMLNIIDALGNYISATGNEEYDAYFKENITEIQEDEKKLDAMCASVDNMLDFAIAVEGMAKLTFPLQDQEKIEVKTNKQIADFLTGMGW